jgi:heptaprenyl diphosphate synthase
MVPVMDARRLSRLGLISAAAIATYVFEGMLPTPVPWLKIGISNVFVVLALFGLGWRDALMLNLARVTAGSLMLGILMSPAFLFSLVGSNAALLVMAVIRRWLVPPLSVIGTSCAGAVVNNLVQVVLFVLLISWSGAGRELLGGFIVMGVGVGLLTGAIAAWLLEKVVLETAGNLG